MKNTIVRNRRAISPVIATVILVAVAITISIAVAYWMGGIASGYTKFEKVEIQTGVCALDKYGNWNVTLSLKNTGSAAATLTNIFVNDIEVNTYGAGAPIAVVNTITTTMTTSTPFTLQSGETKSVIIYIGANYAKLSSGTTVDIKIHSAGGMDYIKLIALV